MDKNDQMEMNRGIHHKMEKNTKRKMKKSMKNGIFLLTFFMILILTGCGAKKEDAASAEAALPGQDWKVEFVELVPGKEGKFDSFAQVKGRLYADFHGISLEGGQYKLQYLPESDLQAQAQNRFLSMAVDVPDYYSPLCFCSDGRDTLYMIASYKTEDATSYHLYRINAGNGGTEHREITDTWMESFGEEHGLVKAAADEDGNVCIAALREEGCMRILGKDGTADTVALPEDCILYDITYTGGKIYCAGNTTGDTVKENTLFCVDISRKTLDEVAALPGSKSGLMLRPGQDGKVLYGYFDGVYAYDPQTKTGEQIYAWMNLGMDARNVKDFFMDSTGRLCVLPNATEDTFALMLLSEPSVSGAGSTGQTAGKKEKETVILCGDKEHDTELAKAVAAFNLASAEYEVEIKKYDYDRLLIELVAGKGPDLIPLTYVGAADCAKRGIIEDLNLYLDRSEKLSRSMLNERVLELCTIDGKLTSIPPSFCISTLFGRESELGDEAGWTLEEFLDYVEAHRGATIMEGIIKGDSRMSMMLTLWFARQGQWVDWQEGKAHFDDGEFERLLRYAKEYEALYDDEYGDTWERWKDGKVLLNTGILCGVDEYAQLRGLLNGDMVAIGFPTWDGEPYHTIHTYGNYGISSVSEHKEGRGRSSSIWRPARPRSMCMITGFLRRRQ